MEPLESGPKCASKSAPERSLRPPLPPLAHVEPEPEADAVPESYDKKPTHVRFLLSEEEADLLSICRGRFASIANFVESLYRVRIILSLNEERFPGTTDRIVMISGLFDKVMSATEAIHQTLLLQWEKEPIEANSGRQFRLVVSCTFCGGIIGKRGATIKAFIEDSHAGIWVSPQVNHLGGCQFYDRLVTITGSCDSQIRAVHLILSKISEDNRYPPHLRPLSCLSAGSVYDVPKFPLASPENDQESCTKGVPEKFINAVVGRGRQNLAKIIKSAGGTIKVSARGDYIRGTTERKVEVTGRKEVVQYAVSIISHRLYVISWRGKKVEEEPGIASVESCKAAHYKFLLGLWKEFED